MSLTGECEKKLDLNSSHKITNQNRPISKTNVIRFLIAGRFKVHFVNCLPYRRTGSQLGRVVSLARFFLTSAFFFPKNV